ncbi:hypothetical protein MBAV_001851 [Candidatus Magnetobacterium bavaricum]|uniref:Peptidase S74 domain-containing protein n=1 Tax=Candidatus Magnetobacterium bavaricum TaxID=29290 RepID=A0A0F3GVS0_9BACT|nr:hypothetical protein MBAV_001851 [Candidatus Magnetobacterium bavaricum]
MRFKSKGLKKVVGANVAIVALLFLTLSAYAGSVPNVFTSGTVAKSSEVNANFTYLGERSWDKSGSNLYYGGGNVVIGTNLYTGNTFEPYTLSIQGNKWGGTFPHLGMSILTSNEEGGIYFGDAGGTYDGGAAQGFIPNFMGLIRYPSDHMMLAPSVSYYANSGNVPALVIAPSAGACTSYSGWSCGTTVNRPLLGISNYHSMKIVVDKDGQLGIGTTTPSYPLHMGSGAYVTTGGVWTNASSREYKKDIQSLTSEDAMLAFNKLEPVSFKYKTDDKQHIGFIAEDVPDLVASKDRKGLSPMDVVALLTKVVQEQQKTIAELQEQQKIIVELKEEVRSLKARTQ